MVNSEYLKNLNNAQKEAVGHIDGPLLIVAGAGSGKTKVLTTRIANIIKEKKAYPNQILAVTFTNKAAKEILPKVLNGEGKPSELVKELGLEQVSDSGELEKIIDEALLGEEENILKFQGGSDRVLGYFVGKCLKATKGKGNPKLINKILLERLKK